MPADDAALTLAAGGDAILTRRLSTLDDPAVDRLFDPVRAADVGVVNLEVLLHDYEGYPAANAGGTYMRAPPWVADELTWAGFDVFAAATNHAGDYGRGGMEATMAALEERDLPYAGLGRTLADAYAPAYVDTPGGRVALVSACSTITSGDEAGEQRPDLQGRPGLAPLALDTTYVVPEAHYEAVVALAEGLGLEAVKQDRLDAGFRTPGVDEDGYAFLDSRAGVHLTFETGDEFAVERTPTEAHEEAVLESVREAERQADWVVASLHTHEGAGARSNDPSVPAFLESFARECVDAGADAFLAHGPHLLRGVEVYDGAPVFYSLGNLMMQNETVTRLPAELYRTYDLDTQRARPADLFDARVRDEDGERTGFLGDRDFWDSVVPVCEFGADGVERVTLYPAELGYDRPRGDRGVPREATGEDATRIFDRVRERSAPYGTELRVEDGVGVLEP